MGVLSQLREKNPKHAERVENIVKYKKFKNPQIVGDKKYLRIVKPLIYNETINGFTMVVDEVVPVDGNKGIEYQTLDEGLRFSVSSNMAAHLEGKTRIRLKKIEPDEDLRCTLYSIWSSTAEANPNPQEGKKDIMITLDLISLNEGMVRSLTDSKGDDVKNNVREARGEEVEAETETDSGM